MRPTPATWRSGRCTTWPDTAWYRRTDKRCCSSSPATTARAWRTGSRPSARCAPLGSTASSMPLSTPRLWPALGRPRSRTSSKPRRAAGGCGSPSTVPTCSARVRWSRPASNSSKVNGSWSLRVPSSRARSCSACGARSRSARSACRAWPMRCSPASRRTNSGRSCTTRTSRSAVSGSRRACCPPARAPTRGSRSARTASSRRAMSSASIPT